MDQDSLITPEVRACIGRLAWDPLRGTVTAETIRQFAEAIEDPNPAYCASDEAIVAPPLYIPPLAPRGVLREDGRRVRTGEFDIPVPLQRRLMAGCEVEFHRPMRPGDQITAETRIIDLFERRGRSGPMVFVVTETRYTDADGEPVRTERWTIVRR